MRALTIWQPWASLIAIEAKPYEFRGWPAHRSVIGERLAIHAGARPVKRIEVTDLLLRLGREEMAWTTGLRPEIAVPLLNRWLHGEANVLPTSHVLCTALLGTPVPSLEIAAEFGGHVNDSDRHEHAAWAWPLTEIQRLEPPVPCRGGQGFWTWRA